MRRQQFQHEESFWGKSWVREAGEGGERKDRGHRIKVKIKAFLSLKLHSCKIGQCFGLPEMFNLHSRWPSDFTKLSFNSEVWWADKFWNFHLPKNNLPIWDSQPAFIRDPSVGSTHIRLLSGLISLRFHSWNQIKFLSNHKLHYITFLVILGLESSDSGLCQWSYIICTI